MPKYCFDMIESSPHFKAWNFPIITIYTFGLCGSPSISLTPNLGKKKLWQRSFETVAIKAIVLNILTIQAFAAAVNQATVSGVCT